MLPSALMLGACDHQVEEPDEDLVADGEDEPLDEEDSDGSEEDEDEDDNDGQDDDTDNDDQDDDDTGGPPPSNDPPAPRPDAAVLCDFDVWNGYECMTDDGQEGTNYCIMVDGEEFYTPCSTEPPSCQPGDGWDKGCVGEICYWDGDSFERYSWSEDDCNTPLVVNFESSPIEFSPARAASFDLSSDGSCMSTDWPTAPWLALDRDGDGFIRSGAELFGSATKMSSGGYAEHGFAALAELDSNRDGKIDQKDDRFGELVLWHDLDEDRVGAYGELQPVAQTSLVSIDLSFDRRAQCDSKGNCGYERTAFEYRTSQGDVATGEVVDVHVACR
ncbi:MAG: hypothetical protein AAF799_12010 [Myxococcota bacterium]